MFVGEMGTYSHSTSRLTTRQGGMVRHRNTIFGLGGVKKQWEEAIEENVEWEVKEKLEERKKKVVVKEKGYSGAPLLQH